VVHWVGHGDYGWQRGGRNWIGHSVYHLVDFLSSLIVLVALEYGGIDSVG